MTTKVNIIIGLAVSILLTVISPFTAKAQEVSSGDTNNGIMLMSENNDVALYGNTYAYDTGAFTETSAQFKVESGVFNYTDNTYGNYVSYPIDTEIVHPIYLTGSGVSLDKNTVYRFKALLNNSQFNTYSDIDNNSTDWLAHLSGQYSYFLISNGKRYELGTGLSGQWLETNLDETPGELIYIGVRFNGSIVGYGTSAQPYQQARFVWSVDNIEYQFYEIDNTISYKIDQFRESLITKLESVGYNIQLEIYKLNEVLTAQIGYLMDIINGFKNELFTKMDEEQEEVINGYDNTSINDTNSNLSTGITQIEGGEEALKDFGGEGLSRYTIPEDGFASYGQKFASAASFVSATIQSVFDASESFTIIISIGFTVLLITIIFGLRKFY